MEYNDYKIMKEKLDKEVSNLKMHLSRISLLRFITMSMTIICLLVGYFKKIDFLYIDSLIFVVIFIYLVYRYTLFVKKLEYLKAKLTVINNYLARFENNWYSFEETGVDYIDSLTGIIKDLDLVGNKSLFQYLNTASTLQGKRKLLNKLTRTSFDVEQLIKEQEAVKELGNKDDFVINIEAYGKMIFNPKYCEKIIEQFIDEMQLTSKRDYIILINLISILTVISLCMLGINSLFNIGIIFISILIFGQWLMTVISLPKNITIFKQVTDLSKCLTSYQNICKLGLETQFDTDYLNRLKKQLTNSHQAFLKLQKIASGIKQRNNLLAGIILNGIFLWDLRCKRKYELWINDYGKQVESWLEAIGELESLISLQVLLKTKKQTTFAAITEDMCLEFEGAYHPLIEDKKIVVNSFTMDNQVCIITGSNMSGKTTFLRTIGINLVLAFAGAPVMATNFKCSPMQIYTSMRLEDDIRGISTFYAELLRIKEIIEANDHEEKMIVLIDEIFKGTNSADRIYGAIETIKRLSCNKNCYTFITTHDFELCDLEKQISCSNYHFKEHYQDNKIVFDYLIKKGRCKTTNAKYLLKMVGITK